jgi:tetratricopeptide (TPR) repeat protein
VRMIRPRAALPAETLEALADFGFGPQSLLREAALPGISRWYQRSDARDVLLSSLSVEEGEAVEVRREETLPRGWKPFFDQLGVWRKADRVHGGEELLLYNPHMLPFWFRLGMNYASQGEALWSEHALRIGVARVKGDKLHWEHQLGKTLMDLHRAAEAYPLLEATLEEARSNGKQNFWLLVLTAQACLQADKAARALVHAEELQRGWPQKSVVHFLLADVYWALKRPDESKAARYRGQKIDELAAKDR